MIVKLLVRQIWPVFCFVLFFNNTDSFFSHILPKIGNWLLEGSAEGGVALLYNPMFTHEKLPGRPRNAFAHGKSSAHLAGFAGCSSD